MRRIPIPQDPYIRALASLIACDYVPTGAKGCFEIVIDTRDLSPKAEISSWTDLNGHTHIWLDPGRER